MSSTWMSYAPIACSPMVKGVEALGLETRATIGMLDRRAADQLAEAGLGCYHHDFDAGRCHDGEVVTTHTYEDRPMMLRAERAPGMAVCCGGILPPGEDLRARAELLAEHASLGPHPESVPIHALVPVEGTPMARSVALDRSELDRRIVAVRIPTLPSSRSSGSRRRWQETFALPPSLSDRGRVVPPVTRKGSPTGE